MYFLSCRGTIIKELKLINSFWTNIHTRIENDSGNERNGSYQISMKIAQNIEA